LDIQTDRALVPANTDVTRYLTVTLTAPDPGRRTERPALNVAFVIDRSGSMSGRKLEMAKKAVEQAIRLLNERDRFALVCYDNEVETLVPSAPASAETKALALKRLKALEARGNTDLCGGWMRGAEEVGAVRETDTKAGADSGVLSRVLLLSDGLANNGETDPEVLARKAAELRAKGIATSTFGVGADFDEVLMSRIATDGGGHFYFIERPAQIPDFLTSELGDSLQVVARDARVIVAAGPGVEVTALNDFPVETPPGELHVRFGDLVAGQTVTVVLAAAVQARPMGTETALYVRLADRDLALFPQPMRVDWQVASATEDAAQPIAIEVLVTVATLLAARARAAAVEANRRGGFEEAAKVLGQAAKAIRALAPGVKQIEVIAAELEEHEEQFAVQMSPMALKQAHFASYNVSRSRDSQGKSRKSR
jgi:Ca-activated chloride channel family protein